MRKKEAIKALEQIKLKLSNDNYKDYVTTSQAKQYINQLFGSESDIYKGIDTLLTNVGYSKINNSIDNPKVIKDYQNKFSGIIQTAIEFIEKFGVPKKGGNFLSKIKNEYIITAIPIIASALFIGGQQYGKYLSDVQNIELRQSNDSLQRVINSFSPAKKNTNSDTTTNDKKTKIAVIISNLFKISLRL